MLDNSRSALFVSTQNAPKNRQIIIICGATATGKSELALNLYPNDKSIIINADSMQIYMEIPILTSQPTQQMHCLLPHKLYGFLTVLSTFSVCEWLKKVLQEINIAFKSGMTPILVGGTGMYIKALVHGIAEIPNISEETREKVNAQGAEEIYEKLKLVDPISVAKIDSNDHKRLLRALAVFEETKIPISEWHLKTAPFFHRENFHIIYLNKPRSEIYSRCDLRLKNMISQGLLDEIAIVMNLYKSQISNLKYPEAIGFREFAEYIRGNITLDSALQKAQQMTRHYAKRQLTWFKNQLDYDEVIEQ